jgi:hypothetical protein
MTQTLYFFQAKCGDAAKLEFQGNNGNVQIYLLIQDYRTLLNMS